MGLLIYVCKYFFNLIYIVLAIAANKRDLYENEEVEQNEGKKLAKELGAIFQETSAKDSTGIDDLFLKIGNKIIDPNCNENEISIIKEIEHTKQGSISIKRNEAKKEKKGCC